MTISLVGHHSLEAIPTLVCKHPFIHSSIHSFIHPYPNYAFPTFALKTTARDMNSLVKELVRGAAQAAVEIAWDCSVMNHKSTPQAIHRYGSRSPALMLPAVVDSHEHFIHPLSKSSFARVSTLSSQKNNMQPLVLALGRSQSAKWWSLLCAIKNSMMVEILHNGNPPVLFIALYMRFQHGTSMTIIHVRILHTPP